MNRLLILLTCLLTFCTAALAQLKTEKPIQVVERVFNDYVQYSESTDSPDDKEAIKNALTELKTAADPRDLNLLLDVWMYYDPTDFSVNELIMPIFEKDRSATLAAINKRIRKKKKWENKEGAPYSDLFKLRDRFSRVFSSENWKSKPFSGDTILLQEGGYTSEELRYYLARPCGYEETTLYWHFKKSDTLHVDVTIRKCYVYDKSKQPADSVLTDKPVLTSYDTLNIHPKMIHITTGHRETGIWKFRKRVIEIIGTHSFNGIYRMVKQGDNEVQLIRKRK